MSNTLLERTALTVTTDEGNSAVLSLQPVTGGLKVSVDAGPAGPSASATWGTKVLADLTTFFVDPEIHGSYATVWRGRVPSAGVAVKTDGTLTISVLDSGFATVVLDAAASKSFRTVLAALSA